MVVPMDSTDKFRDSFKYYKSRQPLPDFTGVVDFSQLTNGDTPVTIQQFALKGSCVELGNGLNPVESWQAYTLEEVPGFVFLVNPFTSAGQKYWINRCLQDYTEKPNHSNVDAHQKVMDEGIWKASMRDPAQKKKLLDKLRWVTLGYHHNWDTKEYAVSNSSAMPAELCCLSECIAYTVGYPQYTAEAAIVNYYPIGSTLAGHVDHSEFDHVSPIISVSFGCTAIFLLGGPTKSTKPIPIYIRSGDIVVMSESCRLSYHAVPRIFDSTYNQLNYEELQTVQKSTHSTSSEGLQETRNEDKSCFTESRFDKMMSCYDCARDASTVCDMDDDASWLAAQHYMSSARININVRQVFPKNS